MQSRVSVLVLALGLLAAAPAAHAGGLLGGAPVVGGGGLAGIGAAAGGGLGATGGMLGSASASGSGMIGATVGNNGLSGLGTSRGSSSGEQGLEQDLGGGRRPWGMFEDIHKAQGTKLLRASRLTKTAARKPNGLDRLKAAGDGMALGRNFVIHAPPGEHGRTGERHGSSARRPLVKLSRGRHAPEVRGGASASGSPRQVQAQASADAD